MGAKKQGFKTLVIVQKGRDKTYTEYFRNLVDDYISVDSFAELTSDKIISILKEKDCLFIPHRYCQVYCDLDALEKKFPIPIFGNKYLLKYEERTGTFNQYQLLSSAALPNPVQFKDPSEIDRLVIVKVKEAARGYERAFFFAKNFAEYKKKAEQLVKEGKIKEEDLKSAVIEEYLIGAQVNFNFFYSPISKSLQLLGTDIRRQTNIDGLIRLPSIQQQEIKDYISPSYIESGHIAITVKESLLEKAFHLAERFIDSVKNNVPPGIIGPFALQTAILPGPPQEKIVIYDLSLRIPGSPGSIFTPYSRYHYGRPVSFGERIAMEIEEAISVNQLKRITT
ncbi:DUF1297 domain-containing protein [Candidatus Gottesmanbacteria bacterium]|nr:DUF1297 domain-containing protein [Candidatus Gottesmanbacteria bacterium]